jgi:predicted ATPase
LSRRLDVLADGAEDLPARQRTLRAKLEWSCHLLTPAEQVLFARMSVFAGGATLDAAEAVCGGDGVPDVLAAVSSLVEKSLLITDPGATDVPRVGMLHVVRAHAADLLADRGEAERLGERHARWFADLIEPADILSHDDAPRHWPLLKREVDNLLAAARWAAAGGDVDVLVALARRLWPWLAYAGRCGRCARRAARAAVATGDPRPACRRGRRSPRAPGRLRAGRHRAGGRDRPVDGGHPGAGRPRRRRAPRRGGTRSRRLRPLRTRGAPSAPADGSSVCS